MAYSVVQVTGVAVPEPAVMVLPVVVALKLNCEPSPRSIVVMPDRSVSDCQLGCWVGLVLKATSEAPDRKASATVSLVPR